MSHSAPSDPVAVADPLTRAMGRLDGCPNACDNTEAPRAAYPLEDAWRCSYLCADCGHAWTTDWRN